MLQFVAAVAALLGQFTGGSINLTSASKKLTQVNDGVSQAAAVLASLPPSPQVEKAANLLSEAHLAVTTAVALAHLVDPALDAPAPSAPAT